MHKSKTKWSGFSGLDDLPENYSVVTYILEEQGCSTYVSLTQQGFANTDAKMHAEQAWGMVLQQMKSLVESD